MSSTEEANLRTGKTTIANIGLPPDEVALPDFARGTFKYYFDIVCGVGTVTSNVVGEVPGGSRVHVEYTGGQVTTDPARFTRDWIDGRVNLQPIKAVDDHDDGGNHGAPAARTDGALLHQLLESNEQQQRLQNAGSLEWFGLQGRVLSGRDWALMRDDGVILFDGRLTLKADDGFVMDAMLSSCIDLRRALQPVPSLQQAAQVQTIWMTVGGTPKIAVTFAVRFEVASGTEEWAAKHYRKDGANYWKYQRLGRGQFIAVGEIDISNRSLITGVSLQVYEVCFGA